MKGWPARLTHGEVTLRPLAMSDRDAWRSARQRNVDAAIRFAKVNYSLALEVANAKERPVWNQGDFFGDTFRK